MNWKAIQQTLIPTKSDLLFLLGKVKLLIFMLIAIALMIGVTVAIGFGMVYVFGEQVTNYIIDSLVVATFAWFAIGWPLYDRYLKFARQDED